MSIIPHACEFAREKICLDAAVERKEALLLAVEPDLIHTFANIRAVLMLAAKGEKKRYYLLLRARTFYSHQFTPEIKNYSPRVVPRGRVFGRGKLSFCCNAVILWASRSWNELSLEEKTSRAAKPHNNNNIRTNRIIPCFAC